MKRNISSIDFLYFSCKNNGTVTCKYIYWMWRTVPFILFLIGVCGNILNCVVLSRPKIRKYSTTIYLLFLASSDIVFLFTSVLNETIYSITGSKIADHSTAFCKLDPWLRYTSGAFSVWLLVLMTIERTIVTKAPLIARLKLSPRLSLKVSLVTLMTIALGNIHLIIGRSYKDFVCTYTSDEYRRFYSGPWAILVLVFYTILPAIVIFIGNANIAVVLLLKRKSFARVQPSTGYTHASGSVLTRAQDITQTQQIATISEGRHASLTDNESRARNHPNASATNRHRNFERRRSSTRLLFTISVFFLLTTLPFCIYAIIRGRLEILDEDDVESWRIVTFIISNLLWCNFSFNFFLYFVSGTLFKQEWTRLIRKAKVWINQLF